MGLTLRMPTPNANHIMASCKTTSCSTSFSSLTLPLPDHSHLSFPLAECNSELSSQSCSTAAVATPIATTTNTGSRRSNASLANMWRDIHGSNQWEDLLEPLHPLLREELIRYGKLITTCYKAFNLNPSSKRYLRCEYGKKNLLREVGMVNSGYDVTKYIYATPSFNIPTDNGICCSRWLGYVAVSSDEESQRLGRRDIAIVFRGTVTNPEWIANFMSSLTPARLNPLDERPDVKVESGFLNLYTSEDGNSKFGIRSCREQLLSEVSKIINKYKGEHMSITIAGHSMGSSISLLLAYDIAELGLHQSSLKEDIPIAVYSFGGPRVGNYAFKERCEELGIKVLRIVNVNDPITKLPGVIFNENFNVFGGKSGPPWKSSCYTHVGVELALDFFNMQNLSSVHDLDSYIKLLKAPRREQTWKGVDIINRARDSLLSMKNLETWQWINLVL